MSGSDAAPWLEALGGGPLAVVCLALAFACWRVINWWREDLKEHNRAMQDITRESVEAMSASTEAVRALTEEVRRGG